MGRRILAIDDDKNLLSTLEDILNDEGYEVFTLSDSSKTEEYIEKYKPDLMIIDIFMPGRTGFNLMEDFRDRGVYLDMPKIFLTCLDDDIEKMTARACGVDIYMTKPFRPEELLEKVARALKEEPQRG